MISSSSVLYPGLRASLEPMRCFNLLPGTDNQPAVMYSFNWVISGRIRMRVGSWRLPLISENSLDVTSSLMLGEDREERNSRSSSRRDCWTSSKPSRRKYVLELLLASDLVHAFSSPTVGGSSGCRAKTSRMVFKVSVSLRACRISCFKRHPRILLTLWASRSEYRQYKYAIPSRLSPSCAVLRKSTIAENRTVFPHPLVQGTTGLLCPP